MDNRNEDSIYPYGGSNMFVKLLHVEIRKTLDTRYQCSEHAIGYSATNDSDRADRRKKDTQLVGRAGVERITNDGHFCIEPWKLKQVFLYTRTWLSYQYHHSLTGHVKASPSVKSWGRKNK